jgi:hypothetical protein
MADTTTATSNGRTFTIVGFVLAAVGLFILPIVLGPVGAVLGFVGLRKGDPLGKWAIVAGIAATIIGMAIGAAIMAAITGG